MFHSYESYYKVIKWWQRSSFNDEEHSSWYILKSRSPAACITGVHFCFKKNNASNSSSVHRKQVRQALRMRVLFVPGSQAKKVLTLPPFLNCVWACLPPPYIPCNKSASVGIRKKMYLNILSMPWVCFPVTPSKSMGGGEREEKEEREITHAPVLSTVHVWRSEDKFLETALSFYLCLDSGA